MSGGDKKSAKKSAKKSKSTGDKAKRKLHPSLVEFRKLVTFISEKIGKGGKPAMIFAGELKRAIQATKGMEKASMSELVTAAKALYMSNPNDKKWSYNK